MRLPRNWDGAGIKFKLLSRTSAGAPRKVKAHEAVVLLTSGLLSILANLDGPTPQEQAKRAHFGKIVGNLTEICRHLMTTENDQDNMKKLKRLTLKTRTLIEHHGSYKLMSLAVHCFSHLPRQLELDGPGIGPEAP